MKKRGIKSIIRRKRNYSGKQGSIPFPNLLKRQFGSFRRYEKMVTDITSIPTDFGMMYLSVIQDLYNNKILSWRLSPRNDLALVLDRLKNLPHDNYASSIFHSDQGMQYVNSQYKKELEKY